MSMLPPRIDTEAVRKAMGSYSTEYTSAEERGAIYKDLIGFLPPRIEARFAVTGALDPKMVDLQEQMREYAMYPKSFDVKTAQLMLFGMLMMDGSDAAVLHAMAARKAGATWLELQETINLCFIFRGMSAANKGAELLANMAKREAALAAEQGVPGASASGS